MKPWVKTSLAPGSRVVAEYLDKAGLQKDLDKLGFNLVGFGCTTCIGNSGPLPAPVSKTINDHDIVAAAVLSGNRNFEGRVNPDVQANYLASPPLVVAFALAGSVAKDLTKEPLGHDKKGEPVFLRDIWPSNAEIQKYIRKNVTRSLFRDTYADVFEGDKHWRKVDAPSGETYKWSGGSTYVRNPPYFEGLTKEPKPIAGYRRGAHSRAVRRQDHHRPHLAGGLDQGGLARGTLAHGAPGRAGGLQPIWHAPRQSRGDDARHFRQYPHQEPYSARRGRQYAGGRKHQAFPRWRDALHL